MKVEEIYALPVDEFGWRVLPGGENVTLGYGVTLGGREELVRKLNEEYNNADNR